MSIEPKKNLSENSWETLMEVARASIRNGLEKGRSVPVEAADYSTELQAIRASFVTLNKRGRLRGCIGHLEAIKPLIEDVAENAYSAAFRDPRFPPLSPHEYDELDIHLSVLTPAVPLPFESESDLIQQLRPGIDGLILVDGMARGTFLPSVWESLPKAEDFLRHLKRKAGLPENHWSETLEIHRYETEVFPD
ncbi:MAG: hypothetical protein OI74_06360 [Gammaproteobacteria bacterium (ex Lamellibrachia satsuma)]|nr:MAG: AmmeMemoRadiSam system protein A [Gammaproteobacteria bacterium (ex Lamellibrachia satsuma)]RRS33949.1 MAG: hypothetical protein OI74_06360 [Gammaproteobacteria bacterium (ex Lamellibrachia satsuma)]RRS37485.1 MAG: hypothetical protein NV67_00860 [Gammaproteobacteria bacterium (ex Lamellibrachia satsuma)]